MIKNVYKTLNIKLNNLKIINDEKIIRIYIKSLNKKLF